MPPWIVDLLNIKDPVAAGQWLAGFFVSFGAGVWAYARKWRAARDAEVKAAYEATREQRMPEQPKRPSEGTVIATARRIWDLEQQINDLRERLARTDRERAELASDAVSLGASLAESERRNEALSAELAELRKSVDSGYTRLPLPPSRTQMRPVDVSEIDDRPTPREGTRLRR